MTAEALACLLATNFLGGSSYAAIAYALRGICAWDVAFWRTAIGVALFLPWLPRALRRLRLEPADWARVAGVSLFGYAVPLVLGVWGQKLSSATDASLLIGIEPVSIVLLSALFLGEPLTALKAVSIAGGLSGAALIVLQGAAPWKVAATLSLRGDLLLVGNGFLWALYSVLGKPVLRRMDSMDFTVLTTALALPLVAFAAWPSFSSLRGAPPAALAAIAYLGIGVTFLGTLTWNRALELVPASQLANFIFLQPVVGVLLGVLLQRETLTPWSCAGGVLILLGVYGATREREPSSLAPAAQNVLESLQVSAEKSKGEAIHEMGVD